MTAPLNPYEDWDRFFWKNNPVKGQKPDPWRLHPVYIAPKRNADGTIDPSVIDAIRTNKDNPDGTKAQGGHYHLDALAENMLQRLEANPSDPQIVERHFQLFIFRTTQWAYQDADNFTVIHVGSAFPQSHSEFFLEERETDAAAANEGPIDTDAQNPPQVLTAIIDDFIGLANTRFSYLDNAGARKTRFQKAWLQETPFRVGDDRRIFLGRSLDRTEINDRLSRAMRTTGVDETTFYDDLYQEGQFKNTKPEVPAALLEKLSSVLPASQISEMSAFDWSSLVQDQVHAFAGKPPFVIVKYGSGVVADNNNDPGAKRPTNFSVTHGTHVLDLVAGHSMETADGSRPIVAVQLPPLATAETSGSRLEHMILSGLLRILNWADDLYDTPAPVVINLSYVLQAGPKNGMGFLEREFDRLIKLRNEQGFATKLVLPIGNGYRSKSRAVLELDAGKPTSLDWRLLPSDQSSNFLEIWYPEDSDLEVTVTTPSGQPIDMANLAGPSDVTNTDAAGRPIGRNYISNRSGLQNRTIALAPTINQDKPEFATAAGAYKIHFENKSGGTIRADVEVQRDDTPRNYRETGYQSYLDHPLAYDVDPETTVRDLPQPDGPTTRNGTMSSLTTVAPPAPEDGLGDVIVVGGAIDRDSLATAALYTASGPARDGRQAPDVSAISDETRAHRGRLASGTFSGSAASVSGTSVAAPIVTRALVDDLNSALPGRAVPAKDVPRLGDRTLPLTTAPGRKHRREWRS